MVQIYTPTINLGCVGFKFSHMVYLDFTTKPSFGMYLRIGENRYSITLHGIYRWK
jgi:hypothetical protein